VWTNPDTAALRLKRLSVQAAKGTGSGINYNSSIFKGDHSEDRLGSFRTKDHLRNGFRADKCNASKPIRHFNRCAVRKFVDRFSLSLNARSREFAGRCHAIHGPCVDKEFGLVSLSATSQTAKLSGDVSNAHRNLM
jgi:hypothetical protein